MLLDQGSCVCVCFGDGSGDGFPDEVGEILKLSYNGAPVERQWFARRRTILSMQKLSANIQREFQVAPDQPVGGLGSRDVW